MNHCSHTFDLNEICSIVLLLLLTFSLGEAMIRVK